MSTVADLQGEISLDPNPFIRGLQQADGAWNVFHGNLTQGSQSFSGISSAAVAMGNVIAAAAIKAAEVVKNIATSVFDAGIAFNAMREQSTIAFTNLLGSAQKAKSFLDELQAFASKTPFEFPDVVKAAQKFTAMGFSAKEVIPILTAVGDAVAGMGGSAEAIDRVSTALVQMRAKGKVSAEEMMQLAEAGIPAWEILATKIGKSIPEAMKLAEKGAISADVAVGALVEGMNAKFGGMMAQQSTTWNGLKSTISDTFSSISGQVMQPFFDFVRDGMQTFVNILPQIQSAIGDLQSWFSQTFSGIKQTVGEAITAISAFYQTHRADIQLIVERVGQLAQDYIRFWGEVAGQVKSSIGVILDDLHKMGISNADIWNGVMFVVNAAVSAITMTIRSITLVVQGVVKAIELAWSYTYNILVKPIADAIAWARANIPIIGSLIDAVASRAAAAMNMYRGIESAVSKSAKIGDLGESVSNSFTLSSAAADRIAKNFKDAGAKAHSAFASGLKGGGGGKGGGKSAVAEAMRDNVAVINEWLREVNAGFTITQRDLETMTKKYVDNLLAQARATEAAKTSSKEFSLQMRSGVIETQAMGEAFRDLAIAARNSADIIAQSMPKVSLSFIKPKEDIAGLEKAMKGLEDAQTRLSKISIKESEERIKAADREFHNITKTYEDLSRTLPDSLNAVFDAIANQSGKVGSEVIKFASTMKGWANDVLGVFSVLPKGAQEAADKVLKTVDKWFKFGDSILSMLGRLGFEVPANMTELIEGMIKNLDFSKVLGKIKEFGSSFLSSLKSIFSSAAGMLAAGAGLFASSFGVSGIGGKLLGAGGGALLGAKLGSMIAPGIGTAIGAIGGAIFGGIFGGKKSKEQKAAEDQAKKTAEINMQAAAQGIVNAGLDGFNKALDFLDKLDDFTAVRKDKFKLFFKQLTKILDYFKEAASQWKSESLEQMKVFAEAVGAVTGVLGNAVSGMDAINSYIQPAQRTVDEFFTGLKDVVNRFGALADEIPNGLQKRANKFAERIQSVVAVIADAMFAFIGDDSHPGLVRFEPIAAEAFDGFSAALKLAVTKMGEIADSVDGGMVKAAQRFSEKVGTVVAMISGAMAALISSGDTPGLISFVTVPTEKIEAFFKDLLSVINNVIATTSQVDQALLIKAESVSLKLSAVFDAIGDGVKAFKAISEFKPLADLPFAAFFKEFDRITYFMDSLIAMSGVWVNQGASLISNINKWGDSLIRAGSAIRAAVTSATPAFGGENITVQARSGVGSGALSTGAQSVVNHNYYTLSADKMFDISSIRTIEDLEREIAKLRAAFAELSLAAKS